MSPKGSGFNGAAPLSQKLNLFWFNGTFGTPCVGVLGSKNHPPQACQNKQKTEYCHAPQGHSTAQIRNPSDSSVKMGLSNRSSENDSRTFHRPMDYRHLSPNSPDAPYMTLHIPKPQKKSLQSYADTPSLLGPHPLSYKQTKATSQLLTNHISPQKIPHALSNITNTHFIPSPKIFFPDPSLTHSRLSPANKQTTLRFQSHHHTTMAMTPEDEALIQKFIGLNTSDNQGAIIQIPQHATTSAN